MCFNYQSALIILSFNLGVDYNIRIMTRVKVFGRLVEEYYKSLGK